MGNKLSSAMTQEETERVQHIIVEVLSTFDAEFSVHLREAVIAAHSRTHSRTHSLTRSSSQCVGKDGGLDGEMRACKLPDCPVPDYILKSGTMFKKGMSDCVSK
jgi:hypothetical protein